MSEQPTLTQTPAATPAAPTPETPAPESPPSWRESETLAPYVRQLEKFAGEDGNLDTEKLAAGYANLEKHRGGPDPASLPVEDYLKGVQTPDSVPDGIVYPDEMRSVLANRAHELGVSAEHFNGLQEVFLAEQGKLLEAAQNARLAQGEADYGELQKEIGAHKMPTYLEAAQNAAKQLGFDLDTAERTPERVAEIRAFAHIASLIGEASLPNPGQQTPQGGAGGLSQAEDIESNPNNPWHAAYKDPSHPQHSDAEAAHSAALIAGLEHADERTRAAAMQEFGGGRI